MTRMCDVCGVRPAVGTIQRIRPGQPPETLHLCELHLAERRSAGSGFGGFGMFDDFFSRFFSEPAMAGREAGRQPAGAPRRGVEQIEAPVRAPKANAFAERFVRTVRHEVLDLTLVLGRRHLDRILRCYAAHYNAQRPHRGLGLRTPAGASERPISPEVPGVRRIDVLGGLIHEYEPVAA